MGKKKRKKKEEKITDGGEGERRRFKSTKTLLTYLPCLKKTSLEKVTMSV